MASAEDLIQEVTPTQIFKESRTRITIQFRSSFLVRSVLRVWIGRIELQDVTYDPEKGIATAIYRGNYLKRSGLYKLTVDIKDARNSTERLVLRDHMTVS